MIKSLVLASYSYFKGGPIGDLFTQWEQAGFFSYVLPFLLIFALVFGILSRLKIFTIKKEDKPNNKINGVLALVVALMSLQFDFVPQFFAEIFPRLGVGLAVVLVAIILLGFFMPKKAWGDYIFLGLGGVVFLVILNKSFGILDWTAGNLSSDTMTLIISALIVLIFIGVIVGVSKPAGEPSSKLMRILAEED